LTNVLKKQDFKQKNQPETPVFIGVSG